VLIRNDQVEVLTVPEHPVGDEAVDRDDVVRFHSQPIAVELLDRNVFDSGWIEAFEHLAAPSDA